MKKILPLLFFVASGLTAHAQTPAITLNVEVDGNERSLIFSADRPGQTLLIDWGNGQTVATEEILVNEDGWTYTTVSGTPVGEGVIKIYGEGISAFECSSRMDGAQVKDIDVTNAPQLTELTVNTNKLTTLDLSQNTLLTKLICGNNPITQLDLSANTLLSSLDANDIQLTELDLTANKALTSLKLNNSRLTQLDLSQNTELKQAYLLGNQLTQLDLSNNDKLTYISLNNNRLTSLDVTGCEALKSLFCMGNDITELHAGNVTNNVNCSNNYLTLATMPVLNSKTFTYAPQKEMRISDNWTVGDTLDLSAQDGIAGLAGEPQATVYTWITAANDTLQAGTDYTEENGKFVFLKAQTDSVFCTMATNAFPKFTDYNAFRTTAVKVEGTDAVETVHNVSDMPVIRAAKGVIHISSPAKDATRIEIYDLSGRKTATKVTDASTVTINVKPGLYIVTVNGKTRKVNAF